VKSLLRGLAFAAAASCAVSAVSATSAWAAAPASGPISVPVPAPVPENAEPISAAFLASADAHAEGPGPIKAFFSLLLGAYSNGVSPADGPTCSFYPTCAGFAKDALHRHGLAEGILMTGDRLMRCNGYDRGIYPRVGSEGRYFDPVP